MMVHKLRTRMAGLLLVLAATGGVAVAVAPASPAFAASCYESSCEGKDPHSTGCDSSVSDRWANWNPPPGASSWSVELRYSSTCRAEWTKITVDDYQATCCSAITVRTDRLVYTPYGYYSGPSHSKTVNAGLEGSWWTVMTVSGPQDKFRSCYYWAPMGDYSCSPWYSL